MTDPGPRLRELFRELKCRRVFRVAFGCAILLVAPGALVAQSVAGNPLADPDPVAVVHSMAEAFNDGDMERVLDHFSDDFRLTLQPAFPSTAARTDSGAGFVRDWVRELIDGDFRIELEVLEAEGSRVRTRTTTWQDITRWTGMAPVVGIEDYVIGNGRISRLTWTATDETWDRFHAFRTRFLVVLGVVTLAPFGGVLWFARRRLYHSHPG